MPSRKLDERGLGVAEPSLTTAVADHYAPTREREGGGATDDIRRMITQLEANANKHDIRFFGLEDPRQGIVHVIGPEQGLTLPGLVMVCGDSHTSTHGAFGAYAFGIGATEVAHVLATQTIWQVKPKAMRIRLRGAARPPASVPRIWRSAGSPSWVLMALGAMRSSMPAMPCAGFRWLDA